MATKLAKQERAVCIEQRAIFKGSRTRKRNWPAAKLQRNKVVETEKNNHQRLLMASWPHSIKDPKAKNDYVRIQ